MEWIGMRDSEDWNNSTMLWIKSDLFFIYSFKQIQNFFYEYFLNDEGWEGL